MLYSFTINKFSIRHLCLGGIAIKILFPLMMSLFPVANNNFMYKLDHVKNINII